MHGLEVYSFYKFYWVIVVFFILFSLYKIHNQKQIKSDWLASQDYELTTTNCEGGKSKRYIPPEWLKKKRCELKLSMSKKNLIYNHNYYKS